MTKRHDDIFDAVLSGVPQQRSPREEEKGRAGARFLKRGNAISDKLSGRHEEKTLHWVDPDRCRMWQQHNRDYGLLTEENCRDLIEGIRSQGQQEFPAIVRRLEGEAHEYEVICGARRHFAVSWLQANNYPQFKYLIEVRDLTDEEAFRLADIENRDREDISDYERAIDYASAVKLYYGGKQKAMAQRLEVTEVWLSRYLELARLPREIVEAFRSIRDLKELHARTLKPLLKDPKLRAKVLEAARAIRVQQEQARAGQAAHLDAQAVMAALKASVAAPKPKKPKPRRFAGGPGGAAVAHTKHGKLHRLEFPDDTSAEDLMAAVQAFIAAEY